MYLWENTQQIQYNSNSNNTYTIDIDKNTNGVEALRLTANSSAAINLYDDYQEYTNVKITLISLTIPPTDAKKALPRELKTIWNIAKATLFGMHTDNRRYTGETE